MDILTNLVNEHFFELLQVLLLGAILHLVIFRLDLHRSFGRYFLTAIELIIGTAIVVVRVFGDPILVGIVFIDTYLIVGLSFTIVTFVWTALKVGSNPDSITEPSFDGVNVGVYIWYTIHTSLFLISDSRSWMIDIYQSYFGG